MFTPRDPVTAAELVRVADQTVAGLPKQKQRLAVAIARHAMAAHHRRPHSPVNLIVLGPTGGGKTYLVKALVEAAGLPYLETDCTQYSETGFAGLDLSSMYLGFLEPPWVGPKEPRRDMVGLAEQHGVVILDEFDKWRMVPTLKERQPGRILQGELLKLIEGSTVYARKRDSERGIPFRTGRVMYIAVGAFEGLSPLMRRTHETDDPNVHLRAEPLDIMEYGFMAELIGRFPTVVPFPLLDPAAMAQILRQHVWPRYEQEAEDAGIHLLADDAALMEVAGQAIQKKIGARAFPTILEETLYKAWFAARPGDQVVLDVPAVIGREARLVRQEAA